MLVCWYTASVFGGIGEELIGMPVWQFATAVKVFCWVMQFYGHGVHEGRSPALLDNLFQAVVISSGEPSFVRNDIRYLNFLFPMTFAFSIAAAYAAASPSVRLDACDFWLYDPLKFWNREQ